MSGQREVVTGGIEDWLAERWAHLERVGNGAYEAGQRTWSHSTRTGENFTAPRPSDVIALGAGASRKTSTTAGLSPEMLELRRQQAAFKEVTRKLDHDNQWMAGLVLAPLAAVGGLEAAPFALARGIESVSSGQPLQLPGRASLLKRGDTYFTRYGRQQDRLFKAKIDAKPTWKSQPRGRSPDGDLLIPDARTPIRSSDTKRYLELKPDTPSGRRAGQQAIKKYDSLGKTRIVFYKPPPR